MAEQTNLNLNQVVVIVTMSGGFPPSADSPRDVALLRAANRALVRKEAGAKDGFLFLFVGKYDCDKVADVVKTYGFPSATIMAIESESSGDLLCPDFEEMRSLAGEAVSRWLAKEHPSAIPYFGNDYETAQFWWTGIEHGEEVSQWPFDASSIAEELPEVHRLRAATWLSVLGHAGQLASVDEGYLDEYKSDVSAAWIATLCEWLHGFEAASGNCYNHFDPSSAFRSIGFSDFYLGFELSRISGDILESICDDRGEDINELQSFALSRITEDLRCDLRNALAKFFGGDPELFWVLHSAIWPQFDKPMTEAMTECVNVSDYEGQANFDSSWRFVTDGWCEEADA